MVYEENPTSFQRCWKGCILGSCSIWSDANYNFQIIYLDQGDVFSRPLRFTPGFLLACYTDALVR